MSRCGGTSETSVTPEIRTLVKQHQEAIQTKIGEKFDTFEPVAATQQVVAGLMYRVKVHVGGESYVHVRCGVRSERAFPAPLTRARLLTPPLVQAHLYDRFGDVSVTHAEAGKTLGESLV